MTSFKIFAYFFVGICTIFQLISIVPQFSGTKTITVYKRNYSDSNAYVKGYKTENGSVEIFDIKVMPKGFWDRLLLTNQDGNLLSNFVKIIAGLIFAFYAYHLTYDNVFSKKSFNLFWFIISMLVMSYVSNSIGRDHTKDFYEDLYKAHGGDENTMYDFKNDARLGFTVFMWTMYYWIPFIVMNLYKTFNDHHEGKVEDDFWQSS